MSAIVPIGTTPFATEASSTTLGVSLSDGPSATGSSGSPGTSAIDSFGSFLGNAVAEANRADLAASQKVEALASGAIDDLHGTMISAKEAEISIKLVGTVRNKILDAFQELWRTSV